MYRWKDNFSKDDLKNAEKYQYDLADIREEDNKVSASINADTIYKVSVSFKDYLIESCECSCVKDSPCCHVAALLYYIENHIDDFKNIPIDEELEKAVFHVDEVSLRNFLFNELMVNEELRTRFTKDFKNGYLLNKEYYYNKLDDILESGMRDEMYDQPSLEVIGNSFYDFINNDVSNLIIVGEDVFACELLNRCAFVLYDDLNVLSKYWYDCAEIFDETASIILVKNEGKSSEIFDELLENTFKISDFGL